MEKGEAKREREGGRKKNEIKNWEKEKGRRVEKKEGGKRGGRHEERLCNAKNEQTNKVNGNFISFQLNE